VDAYFERFADASNQEGFDINTVEQLMLENQGRFRQMLNEANEDLTSSVETTVKKNAPGAGPRMKGRRKGKSS
jgi:hypothetical protein